MCYSVYSCLCSPQRQQAAEREAEASGAKIMRLEVELAEARKALQATVELEKEVAHYRYAPHLAAACQHVRQRRHLPTLAECCSGEPHMQSAPGGSACSSGLWTREV